MAGWKLFVERKQFCFDLVCEPFCTAFVCGQTFRLFTYCYRVELFVLLKEIPEPGFLPRAVAVLSVVVESWSLFTLPHWCCHLAVQPQRRERTCEDFA